MTKEAANAVADQESPENEQERDDGFNEEANSTTGLQKDGALELPDDDKKPAAKPKEKPKEPPKAEGDGDGGAAGDADDKGKGKAKEGAAAGGEGDGGGEPKPPQTAAEKAEAAAKKLEEEGAAAQAESVLDILPDSYSWAKDVVGTDKFNEFVGKQPKAVRKAAQSGDPDDAMYVLDLYKASQGEAAPASAAADAKVVSSLIAKFGNTKFTAPDGSEKTIKQISEEYGNAELIETFGALVNAMNADSIKSMKPAEKSDVIDKLQARIDAMAADAEFWDTVHDAHSDGKALARSGKVGKWVETQNASYKRLYNSGNPEHAILVLDAYKEAMAKAAGEEEGNNGKDKKKKIDGLHSETLSGKREVKASEGGKDDDAEFDEGFNEEADKK
jgi:hypothetical protein